MNELLDKMNYGELQDLMLTIQGRLQMLDCELIEYDFEENILTFREPEDDNIGQNQESSNN